MPHLLDATMFWSAHGGGVRRYLEAKRVYADTARWRHTVATPLGDGISGIRLPAVPLPVSGGYRLPVQRHALAGALASQMPDVIEAGDPYRIAWAAIDAGQRLGVPTLAFCHSNLELLAASIGGAACARAFGRAARRYAYHVYRHFDAVLAPSESMCGHLAEWGVTRVRHQPLGVDSEVFHPRRRDPAWRRALGLGDDARLLLYAGRFAPEKNLHVLTDAVRRLGAPYRLIAVGGGPTPPSGERVTVLPPVAGRAELATLVASADAFVHAGDQETFGMSIVEALACGVPVVGCAREGVGELIDSQVGLAVDDARSEKFAEGIAALFAADLPAMRQAARIRGEEYDWRLILPCLWQHYHRLLGRTVPCPALPVAAA